MARPREEWKDGLYRACSSVVSLSIQKEDWMSSLHSERVP